jgi:centromere protein J
LKFPSSYHGQSQQKIKLAEEVIGHDGKIQRIYENGKKEVVFTNGVKREVWPDGYSIVYFNNNDIKQTYPDGKIAYYFSEAKTTQTTFPNGLQVFKFANSQIEKHFADGTKEISFPDGEEESIFPDGTIQKIEKSGIRIIEFPHGQRVSNCSFPPNTLYRMFFTLMAPKSENSKMVQ